MDYNSVTNQDIKRKFVEREVIYCASTLVYELAQKAESFPDYYDDLLDAYRGMPDYQEAAEQNGWSKTDDGFVHDDGETSDADDWEELCNEQDIDGFEYAPEILEHWIVTDYLADKLESHNERVLRDFFGMTIWCRSTSGQAILLDHVISEICEEMEILEGQKYSWAKGVQNN